MDDNQKEKKILSQAFDQFLNQLRKEFKILSNKIEAVDNKFSYTKKNMAVDFGLFKKDAKKELKEYIPNVVNAEVIKVLGIKWNFFASIVIFLSLITGVLVFTTTQTGSSLRAEMGSLKSEMTAEMGRLRANVRDDVREELKGIKRQYNRKPQGETVSQIASEDHFTGID